jgi:hypothetical protein
MIVVVKPINITTRALINLSFVFITVNEKLVYSRSKVTNETLCSLNSHSTVHNITYIMILTSTHCGETIYYHIHSSNYTQ